MCISQYVHTIRKLFDLFEERECEKWVELFDETAKFEDPYSDERIVIGKPAIYKSCLNYARLIEESNHTILDVFQDGQSVAVIVRQYLETYRGCDAHFNEFYLVEFREDKGLITSVKGFFDVERVMKEAFCVEKSVVKSSIYEMVHSTKYSTTKAKAWT